MAILIQRRLIYNIILTLMWPRIVNVFFQVYQQDATLYNILYYCQCSTCFRRFLRPSSGAEDCTHSIGYTSSLLAATARGLPLNFFYGVKFQNNMFSKKSSQKSPSNRTVSENTKYERYVEQPVYSYLERPFSCLPSCCQTLKYLQPKCQDWKLGNG